MKRKVSKSKLLRSKPFLIKRTRAGKQPVGLDGVRYSVDYCEVLTNGGLDGGLYRAFSVCEDGFKNLTGLKLRPGRKRMFRLVEVKSHERAGPAIRRNPRRES